MNQRKKYVGQIRVSTRQQGVSGLGLEAQRQAIEEYVASVGGELVAIITEVESGGNRERISAFSKPTLDVMLKKRPKLVEAIKLAQQNDAILVVKEASRLTRHTLVMDYLLASVKFVCADTPHESEANIRLQTHFNEMELVKISQRTKAALQILKKRRKLGTPANLTKEARLKAVEALQNKALMNPHSQKAMDLVHLLRTKNKLSYRAIADILNGNGFVSPNGKMFWAGTVWLLNYRKELLIRKNKQENKQDEK